MSGKTDTDVRLAGILRARARSAFVNLHAAFQEADRAANGAYSRGNERLIFPGLVSGVMRLVVGLFAAARGIDTQTSLLAIYDRLSEHNEDKSFAVWPHVLTAWDRLYVSRGLFGLGERALFDPRTTPFLSAPISNDAVARIFDALLVGEGMRLDYSALHLEHVGTFYEGLMAFDSLDSRVHYDISTPVDMRVGPSDDRRRLGAHYTSNAITRIVVERTLAPLTGGIDDPDKLLALRICDPAMGSGAFLLEASRFLAAELVRIWEKRGDSRRDLDLHARRLVAQHCLFGVDKNPRAVELARWTLWLSTASRGTDGVFLDQHARIGDSLVGRPDAKEWFAQGLPPKLEKRSQEFQRRHLPFHWDDEFPAVLARGGFDAFIGNPPWVSYAGRAAQPLDDDLRKYYTETNLAFAGYRNLQGLFISRCASMLRPSGRLGFVLPSSMSELGGYAPTRRAHEILCECDDDLPDFGDVFDDVFQPSMALISTRRDKPISIETARVWPLQRTDLQPQAIQLLTRLSRFATFPPEHFGERGFQSMGDDIQHLHALDAPRGALRVGVRVGGDVEPFLRRSPKFYCDPKVFNTRFRPESDWQNVALLIRQTARFPMVVLSDGQAFRNSILAGFSSETYSRFFLVAWLNSSPIRWYHYARNRDARQGMPQVKISHLRALPAPRSLKFVKPIEKLGRVWAERNTGITPAEQKKLDDLVAKALEFDAEDRQIVENWLSSLSSK